MSRDYAAEIRDRMQTLGRYPRPRHQHLIRDAKSNLAVCRIVMRDEHSKDLRYVYTFGRCHEGEWIADSPHDRATTARLREHTVTGYWSRGSTVPLLYASDASDQEAALALAKELGTIVRWLRVENALNDRATTARWLLAQARGKDQSQEGDTR